MDKDRLRIHSIDNHDGNRLLRVRYADLDDPYDMVGYHVSYYISDGQFYITWDGLEEDKPVHPLNIIGLDKTMYILHGHILVKLAKDSTQGFLFHNNQWGFIHDITTI